MIRPQNILWRLLWPVRVTATPLYAAGLQLHKGLYAAGIKHAYRPPVPVICVGNLSMGGTGKTPLVIAIVKMLQEAGRTVGVLTRGYRRSAKVARAVRARDSRSPISTHVSPSEIGDEPFLMTEKLPGAHILVGADRAASARIAVEEFACDVVVMDDGFQHWALERDLDVVVLDASQPDSLNHLLPWGNLREGFGALRRAHIAVIAKARNQIRRDRVTALVRAANPSIAVWHVDFQPRELKRLGDGSTVSTASLSGQPVILVCGIASPEGFEHTALALGCRIEKRFFYPDHFIYPDLVIRYLEIQAQKTGARCLLTTEKDAVKLRGRTRRAAPWFAVTIETRWLDPSADAVRALLAKVEKRKEERRNEGTDHSPV